MFNLRKCRFVVISSILLACSQNQLPAQDPQTFDAGNLPVGIASWEGTVYRSDISSGEILARSPNQSSFATFLKDPRIVAPRALALDATYIYIADPTEHQVFRVNRSTKDVLPMFPQGTPVTPIDLICIPSMVDSTPKISTVPSLAVLDSTTASIIILTPYADDKYLESSLGGHFMEPSAVSRYGSLLLVSDFAANTLYEAGNAGIWQDIRTEQATKSFAGANGLQRATGHFFPLIAHPQSITGFSDFIYIVQEHELFAYLPSQDRLISLVNKSAPPPNLSKVVVSTATNELLLVGNSVGDLASWPIMVPMTVEVAAGGDVSTPLADLYSYLWDQGALPTVSVTLPGGSQSTCKTVSCLVEQVRFLLPHTNASMERLLCKMNPDLCSSKGMKKVQPGTVVKLPDAPFEPYCDYELIVFDGRRSIAAYLDQFVPDIALRSTVTLQAINDQNKSSLADLSSIPAKGQKLFIPIQRNRYFLSIDKAELYSRNSGLASVVAKYKSLSVTPFGSASQPLGVPDSSQDLAKHNVTQLTLLHEKALSNIAYNTSHAHAYGDATGIPVLIDEDAMDCQHPVFFGDAQDDRAFTGVGCAKQESAETPTFVDWSMSDSHHGTCVASIVGGRSGPFGPSLAQGVELDQIKTGEMTHENLIGFYNKALEPFIVNISNGDAAITAPNKWRNLISQTLGGQSVLFIAAAGNEGGLLSDKGDYPAMLARDFPNVISVGALDSTGHTAWTSQDPALASNTGFRVELLAPGELIPCATDVFQGSAMYSAPAGTSFAAPVVTSVAALLLQRHLSPTEVKARLLATADPVVETKQGQPLALFGRLNVENALLNPRVFHVNYTAAACGEGNVDQAGQCHVDVDVVEQPTLSFVDPEDALSTRLPVVFSYLLSIRKGSVDPNGVQLTRLVSFSKGINGANSTIDLRNDVRLDGCIKVKSIQTDHVLFLSFGAGCPEAQTAADPNTVLDNINFLIAPTLGAVRVGQDHH